MFSKLKNRMSYANVVSTTALVVALVGGGTAVAASRLPHNSVGSPQIVNHAVKAVDLARINTPRVFGPANLGIVRGYAWNDSPDADADLTDNGYTYNRSGGAVTVTHEGTGSYEITFAGVNLRGGNVVVSGYDAGASWCKVGGWGPSTVSVFCYDATGALVDNRWTIALTD